MAKLPEIAEKAKRKPGRPPGPQGMRSVTKRNYYAMQKMFQEHEQEALETMLGIMRDPEADHAVRLKAANDVLNRARGTPLSASVVMTLDEAQDGGASVSAAALSAASTPELLALAEALAKYVDANPTPDVIDVTPVFHGGADDAGNGGD